MQEIYNRNNSVSLFIGSSFKLMAYRHCVGNMLRQLNDKWEQQGIRLFLKRWEDFRTEYEGVSKQKEYIDELVLPSDFCAFFFREEIGKYTERELDACIANKHQHVVCYRVPDKEGKYDSGVKGKLEGKGLTVKDVKDKQELIQDLRQRLEVYMQDGHLATSSVAALPESFWFYTTIPEDNASERDEFGTIIRSLDDFCEEYFGARCRLHPMHRLDLLEHTHHYTPFIKDEVSEWDLKEFETALKLQEEERTLKSITLFTKPGTKILDCNVEVKKLIGSRDLFYCNVKYVDTIRWRLMSWVMRQQSILLTATSFGLTMESGYVYMRGVPMVSLTTLDSTGKASALIQEVENIDYEIRALLKRVCSKEDDEHILSLNRKKNRLQAKLQLLVSECISNAIYEQFDNSEGNPHIIDFDSVEDLLEITGAGLISLDRQKERILETLVKNLQVVNEQIKHLSVDVKGQRDAEDLKRLAEIREKLTRRIVEYGGAEPMQLLGAQLFLVSVHDTYLHPNIATSEEDAVFERILNDALRFGVADLQVEIIRLNYSNSFIRKEEYGKAVDLLREAITNVERIETETWYVMRFKTTLYLRAYNAYFDMGDKSGMSEMITRLGKHTDRCQALDRKFIEDRAIYLSAMLTYLTPDDDGEEKDLQEAISVANWIDQNLNVQEDNPWFGEVCIMLPNMIAAYMIDHRINKSPSVINTMNKHAMHFLDICEKNAQKLMKVNLVEGLYYVGEVNHQKGFLLYNFGPDYWRLAENYYELSLQSKQRIMQLEDNYSSETSYAQTLVNWGAVKEGWLELRAQGISVEIPGESVEKRVMGAVEIYKRHKREDNINSEQHYYEALQLLGTLYYFRGEIMKDVVLKNEGLELLKECWDWNLRHLDNTYHTKFEHIAGKILKKEFDQN